MPQPPEKPEDTEQSTVAVAEQLLDRGEPLLAYNAAQAGLRRWAASVRLRQL